MQLIRVQLRSDCGGCRDGSTEHTHKNLLLFAILTQTDALKPKLSTLVASDVFHGLD
jgi:hypothetical protein